MSGGEYTTLREVLASIDALNWRAWLFLPPDPDEWELDTPVLVIEGDDIPEGEDVPASAADRGLTREFGVVAAQDVVEAWNENAERPGSDTELLAALRYYGMNDAFLYPED